jgi:hypothetical protein
MVIRKEYRLTNDALNVFLALKRLNRDRFVPVQSTRDVRIIWKKRMQANNKHTLGTEVW